MVFIWTNKYSQGYIYAKNCITLINGNKWNFIEMKRENIGVVKNTNGYKKFVVYIFLML